MGKLTRDRARVTTSESISLETSIPGTASDDFVENTSMKELLRISDSTLNQAMAIAYQLYMSRRLVEADIVCTGLIACDHHYWWPRSLHASVLRRLGRAAEALQAVEEGLKYAPTHPKLLLMHAELLTAIDRKRSQSHQPGPEHIANAQGVPDNHASVALRSSNGVPT